MSSSNKRLVDALRQFGNTDSTPIFATVTGVDEEAQTCTCITFEDIELYNVRLKAAASEGGLLIIPTIDSSVMLTQVGQNVYVVIARTQVDKVVYSFGESNIVSLSEEEVVFYDGEFGGLIKIQELTDKLNGLVGEVNALKNAYNSHIHTTTATVGLGPVGVIAPTTTTAQNASNFDKSDFENEKIKH